MFGFIVGAALGGAVVWFGKAKLLAWYDSLVMKI